jgi:hypothetical protein
VLSDLLPGATGSPQHSRSRLWPFALYTGCRSKPATSKRWKRADDEMCIQLREQNASPKPGFLAFGYLRMAETDGAEICRLRLALGKYCQRQGYRLVTVFCDRDVRDTELARPGFTGVVDAASSAETEQYASCRVSPLPGRFSW